MHRTYLGGLALGLSVGAISIAILNLALDLTKPEVDDVIFAYLSVILPVVGATIAVLGVSYQIHQAAVFRERERLDRLDAAVTVLPLVLKEFHGVCDHRVFASATGKREPILEGYEWEISANAIETIKECVQFAEGEPKQRLQQIVRIYQVLTSRWGCEDWKRVDLFSVSSADWMDRQKKMWRAEQYREIENWLDLKHLSGSLFRFARNGKEPTALEDVKRVVVSDLRFIGDKGPEFGAGTLLSSFEEYNSFIETLEASNVLGMIADNWER
ncbi:hypothetical protein [Leisingera sp. ANG-M6]|uniref:hypothetical protein n=1 Tax=Leisingera sp. ANG-M6 TaxID=1577900 RepID=UPI000580555E|nr:hypothetical protein [Leisingera sp. ANG-M6]KIC30039.1 hypothetical protein RA24_03595 [Leisingera sp. ANG-M6]